MANDNYNKNRFTNASTLARREWIESALTSVRQKLDASTFLPSTIESLGHELGHEADRPQTPQCSERPHLYLAWSEGQRRSGT